MEGIEERHLGVVDLTSRVNVESHPLDRHDLTGLLLGADELQAAGMYNIMTRRHFMTNMDNYEGRD